MTSLVDLWKAENRTRVRVAGIDKDGNGGMWAARDSVYYDWKRMLRLMQLVGCSRSGEQLGDRDQQRGLWFLCFEEVHDYHES